MCWRRPCRGDEEVGEVGNEGDADCHDENAGTVRRGALAMNEFRVKEFTIRTGRRIRILGP